jgi:hypothetical protein
MRKALKVLAGMTAVAGLLFLGSIVFNGTVNAFSADKPKTIDARETKTAHSLFTQGR